MRSLGAILGYFNFTVLVSTSIQADLSPAVILSISSISCFLSALVFYIAYNETIRKNHFVGMIMIVMCIVSIAISKSKTEISTTGET